MRSMGAGGQMQGQSMQSGQQSDQQMGMVMPEGQSADDSEPAEEGGAGVAMIAGAAVAVVAVATIMGLSYKGCRSKASSPPQTVSTSKGLGAPLSPTKQLQLNP